MNTNYRTKKSELGYSPILNSRFSIFNSPKGISLMEVLASVFVVGVGLLGVLAVIPFGAFQVSKANHADYCANMLRTAGAEIRVQGLAKPETWNNGGNVPSNSGSNVWTASNEQLDCSHFIMIDPFDTVGGDPSGHIYKVGSNLVYPTPGYWQEAMRGPDDLLYTLSEDAPRPAWTPSGSPTPLSSGKYTWFFTFKPEPLDTNLDPLNAVSKEYVRPRVSVDVLACYNRSPGDPQAEQSVNIIAPWAPLLSGATVTLATNVPLDGTKYIFVTWQMVDASSPIEGSWCRIVSKGFDSAGRRTVTLVGSLPSSLPAGSAQAFIVDGVLYHTRIDNVPLFSN